MGVSSRPRRRRLPPQYLLILERGGSASLTDPSGETIWRSQEDELFLTEFPGFLIEADTWDILDYLEREAALMTAREADACKIVEDSYTAWGLLGAVLQG